MIDLFLFLVSISGIVLLAALIGGVVDKEGKWTELLRTVSIFSAKISSVFLAIFVMSIVNNYTLGILAFSTIGTYIACLAIIWSAGKDIFGNSKLASDISVIAVNKASEIQARISEKASQISEESKLQSEKNEQK